MSVHPSVMSLVVAAALLMACGSSPSREMVDSSPEPATAEPALATPTRVPFTPFVPFDAPTKSAIEAAPVLHDHGWLVYRRGDDLYAGDLQSGKEIGLTSATLGGQYAGHAEIDGRTWVYYTSLTGAPAEPGQVPWTFIVHRRPLDGGLDEEESLFHADISPEPLPGSVEASISVSSDGNYVVYITEDGVHLYDVVQQSDRLLLSSQPSSDFRSADGVYYGAPEWAPVGAWLSIKRTASRRGIGRIVTETIRPLEPNTEYTMDGVGGARWHPSGTQLCATVGATRGLSLVSPGSAETRDLTASVFDNATLHPPVASCAWSADGRLAVSYEAGSGNSGLDHFTIAVLDASGTPANRVDAGAVWPQLDYWLPDGSGFVIATANGPSEFHSAAIMLDGTYRRLPFDAGWVMGAIPAR